MSKLKYQINIKLTTFYIIQKYIITISISIYKNITKTNKKYYNYSNYKQKRNHTKFVNLSYNYKERKEYKFKSI